MAHGLLPSALRPAPPGDHRRRSRPRDGGGRRGGEHRALHRATPALLAARSIGPRAGPAPGALHAGGDAARPEEDGAGQMNGLVLRSAIERARVSWRGIAAAALGAIAACLAVAFASPLSLAGGARVQQAAALFAADLAQYRAAPADLRAAPLVSAAAAGYEDRAFFHRPRWVPPLSPPGIARALVRNLRGIQQGGSTIPQQLAKLYLREGPRGDLLDKGREALFATWLVRQAAPDEIAGVYLNLSAATSMGTARRPAEGLNRLSLALFGLPLRRLAREDQLVLGASPRGVQWLRAHPVLSAHRIAATRDWLVSEKLWDTSVQSYLDGAGIDPGGAVLARSGAESALMAVNYGSVAKLEALDLAVEAFGPEAVRELMLPPGACVRWIWSTKELRRSHPSRYCPTDVAPATRPMALDEAVARSVNSMTTRHAILLPALLAQRRPDLLREVAKELSPQERAALDSPADRALAGDLLAQLGEALPPDSIPPELSYSAAGVALFRYLRDRREQAGLPAERLPEDPTSLLGNSSRATPEQIGAYLHRKLFANDGTCMLSDTGALRPLHPPLPDGLQGSVLLRGIDAYLRELAKLQRKPSSALLPAWAEPPAPAEIAAEA